MSTAKREEKRITTHVLRAMKERNEKNIYAHRI